jgi:hypothetical protein
VSRFRILDINGANTSHKGDIPSKPCAELGCSGTMYLHEPMEDAPWPTHLEFPRTAAWVCANDPAHTEIVSLAGYWWERRKWSDG